jgi:hypothetical protein
LAAEHGRRVARRVAAAGPTWRLRYRDPADAARVLRDALGAGAPAARAV